MNFGNNPSGPQATWLALQSGFDTPAAGTTGAAVGTSAAAYDYNCVLNWRVDGASGCKFIHEHEYFLGLALTCSPQQRPHHSTLLRVMMWLSFPAVERTCQRLVTPFRVLPSTARRRRMCAPTMARACRFQDQHPQHFLLEPNASQQPTLLEPLVETCSKRFFPGQHPIRKFKHHPRSSPMRSMWGQLLIRTVRSTARLCCTRAHRSRPVLRAHFKAADKRLL